MAPRRNRFLDLTDGESDPALSATWPLFTLAIPLGKPGIVIGDLSPRDATAPPRVIRRCVRLVGWPIRPGDMAVRDDFGEAILGPPAK